MGSFFSDLEVNVLKEEASCNPVIPQLPAAFAFVSAWIKCEIISTLSLVFVLM